MVTNTIDDRILRWMKTKQAEALQRAAEDRREAARLEEETAMKVWVVESGELNCISVFHCQSVLEEFQR